MIIAFLLLFVYTMYSLYCKTPLILYLVFQIKKLNRTALLHPYFMEQFIIISAVTLQSFQSYITLLFVYFRE